MTHAEYERALNLTGDPVPATLLGIGDAIGRLAEALCEHNRQTGNMLAEVQRLNADMAQAIREIGEDAP